MTVTQYIGARYVPLFSDPLEWDITKEYEPLTIVYWQGNSYTSRQAVPSQIDINNETYWALTGNYNAQIEQYRREVKAFDDRITTNTNEINALEKRVDSAESTLEVLGTAAKKNWTNQLVSKGTDLPTAGAVYDKLEESTTDIFKAGAYKGVDSTPTTNSGNLITSGAVKTEIDSIISTIASTKNEIETNAKKEVIVILGDSWSDPTVAAVKWPDTIKKMFNNAEIHNYAKNGCRTSNGTFQNMYNAFVNDKSFDKSTITRCILVYGVNDFYTTAIDASTARSSINSMYSAVIPQLPSNVNIDWFINYCYGRYNYDAITQIDYWKRVITNVAADGSTRLIPHEMWSWFGVSELNQDSDNYFHLTETANRWHLPLNIYKCLTGGEPIRYNTYAGKLNGETIKFNVNPDSVECHIYHVLQSGTVSNNNVPMTEGPILPIQLDPPITNALPGGFLSFSTLSQDGKFINRVAYAATGAPSGTEGRTSEVNFKILSSL